MRWKKTSSTAPGFYHAPNAMSRMRLVGCNFEQARGTEISIAKLVESMSGARTTNANAS